MDETQKRKLSAKEFIVKNQKIGYGILGLFISLFIVYFAFVYFYSKKLVDADQTLTATTTKPDFSFMDLLPIFKETTSTSPILDSSFLGNFGNNNLNSLGENTNINEGNDNSKIIKIENTPVLTYTIYDKPISIKNYIKNKPKICAEKLEPVTAKDTKSIAVKNFQAMLASVDDYAETPDTGILDNKTREQIYIFQKRYADILYKTKTNKEPTRVIDKETTHFLNLLCGFDSETTNDFVQVPTLRYVTKENLDIYDYNLETKEKVKIAARNATGTQDLVISANGDFLVPRRESNEGIITEFYNVRTKNVTRLERNITTLDFNSKNLLVFGVPTGDGMSIKTFDFGQNIIKTIAQIPLTEWNLVWLDDKTIGISNKPSAFAQGIFMSLNTTTKKLTQLAGPLLGLSVQKTTNDFSILSTGGLGEEKTFLLNNKTRNIGDLGIKTFAEKCSSTVFASGIFCGVPKDMDTNKVFPDDWYKGKVSFNDVLVYKSISGTTTTIISYLEGKPISITKLNINKNGIFFIDENTLNLYSLEL